jgi:glycosyltransferase involved in cell wall biosynthesis
MTLQPEASDSRRVTLVPDELLGYVRTGGLGTATSFLALALARMGHQIEVLYAGGQPTTPLGDEWARLYDRTGVAIRTLPDRSETVEPPYFARMRQAELALAADPPDVVITQDLAAPCYTALRLRQLGLAFRDTLFVVWCHGTRQWITDTARKVRVLPGALAITELERASVELADVAVSPSVYMLDWMRRQGWRLPDTTVVIPLLTRSGATGEPPPEPVPLDGGGRVARIAVFGRLEERKGLRPFVAGLNALEPELLEGLELEFVGRATPAWPADRVEGLLSQRVRRALARVSFLTDLDQPEALARLRRPRTLALMPSLEDNSPNTVYECLERGIPFIASRAGGIGELVAPEDRVRVLFEPTPEGIAEALRRVLSADALEPARPAFDDATSLEQWAEVLATPPRELPRVRDRPAVDVVVVHRQSTEALSRCLAALARQTYREGSVTVAITGNADLDVPITNGLAGARVVRCEGSSVEVAREAGLRAGSSPWVVFLDEEDVPKEDLIETLVRAQGASGADVVSCGLRLPGERLHFFAGEPGGLGLLANGYGRVALLRRALLTDVGTPWQAEGDPDWPLLAGLAAAGAHIVSVPIPLVTTPARPGTLDSQPSDALLAVEELERALPDELRFLARLVAGQAAEMKRLPPAPRAGLVRPAVRVLRDEGPLGLLRRALRRLFRGRR